MARQCIRLASTQNVCRGSVGRRELAEKDMKIILTRRCVEGKGLILGWSHRSSVEYGPEKD
jgi:hypothetical protein